VPNTQNGSTCYSPFSTCWAFLNRETSCHLMLVSLAGVVPTLFSLRIFHLKCSVSQRRFYFEGSSTTCFFIVIRDLSLHKYVSSFRRTINIFNTGSVLYTHYQNTVLSWYQTLPLCNNSIDIYRDCRTVIGAIHSIISYIELFTTIIQLSQYCWHNYIIL